MSRSILVGFDGSEHAHDAIVLGALLARPFGDRLTAVCVYLFRPIHREGDTEFEDMVRNEARRRVAGASDLVSDPVPEIRVVRGHSAAAGLQDLAAESGADLIVVGSTHHGPLGRVMSRGTPEALLHDAPCAVAVAPRGYATDRSHALRTVGVGFDGGAEAYRALAHAAEIARRAGARLEVIAALEPVERRTPHAFDVQRRYEYDTSRRSVLQRDLGYAVADLENVHAVPVTVDGPAADALCERSKSLDLLVLGSRCFGAVRRVVLGSVSAPVLRHASSPVLVVPRTGAEGDSLSAGAPGADPA